MWGEKMRPHWPTSASFAGGFVGVAHVSILSFEASRLLNARLVRFSAWRSIVVSFFFVLFSPESFWILLSLSLCYSGLSQRCAICCRRRALYVCVLCTLLLHSQMAGAPAGQLKQAAAGVRGFSCPANLRNERSPTALAPLHLRTKLSLSSAASQLGEAMTWGCKATRHLRRTLIRDSKLF